MSNQTILVVDDEQDLLDLIEYNLKKEGFKVLQAENGYDGIQLAKSEIPDLVIHDIMMPKMGGLEVCEFIGDISHELKTPTFAIQGFVETLLNGALEDEEVNRVFLNKVMKNVNRVTERFFRVDKSRSREKGGQVWGFRSSSTSLKLTVKNFLSIVQ